MENKELWETILTVACMIGLLVAFCVACYQVGRDGLTWFKRDEEE